MADEIKDTPPPLTDAQKIKLYEQNGAAKLYYALNRKMNEMADMLNKHNLGTMDVDDAKAKTFDRLKVIWNDAAGIAQGVEALGKMARVTGNEQEDISKKPFVDTIAESRK
jgi:hypothetical protein